MTSGEDRKTDNDLKPDNFAGFESSHLSPQGDKSYTEL